MGFFRTLNVLFLITLLCSFAHVESLEITLHKRWPGFKKSNLTCSTSTKEGTFYFDDSRGIGYIRIDPNSVYFEFYAPSLFWIGLGSLHQIIGHQQTKCKDCLITTGNNITECVGFCINGNSFVVHGRGDAHSTHVNEWEILETLVLNLQLASTVSRQSVSDYQVSEVSLCQNQQSKCIDYVHVSFRRTSGEDENGDIWIINNLQPEVCVSWIASDPSQGSIVRSTRAESVHRFGFVCTVLNDCFPHVLDSQPSFDIVQFQTSDLQFNQPTSLDTAMIVIHPEVEMQQQIPSSICGAQNISLVILLDGSESISLDSFNKAKIWVLQLIEYLISFTNAITNRVRHKVCFRVSLIAFATNVEKIWSLQDFINEHGCTKLSTQLQETLFKMQRPQSLFNTISDGAHTADAIQAAINETMLRATTNDKKFIFVVSDGFASQSPCHESFSDVLTQLQQNEIRVTWYGIGLGPFLSTSSFDCLFPPHKIENSFFLIDEQDISHFTYPVISEAVFAYNCSNLYSGSSSIDTSIPVTKQQLSNTSCKYLTEKFSGTGSYCPDAMRSQWRISLSSWAYNRENDITEVKYEICTMSTFPFNPCTSHKSGAPQPLKTFVLQMACDCESNMQSFTKRMDPIGFTNQKHKLWLWSNLDVSPGTCQSVSLHLYGYITPTEGVFVAEDATSSFWTSRAINVPKACAGNNFPGLSTRLFVTYGFEQFDTEPSCGLKLGMNVRIGDYYDSTHVWNAPHEVIPFPTSKCQMFCNLTETEFALNFVGRWYNETTHETKFEYEMDVQTRPPHATYWCNKGEVAAAAENLIIELPCQCKKQLMSGDEALSSLTNGMQPSGYVEKQEFHWERLRIDPGSKRKFNIVVKGNVLTSIGMFTIGGDDYRCGGGHVEVPDPCSDRCQYGQWKLIQEGLCSQECGGGILEKRMLCVSVCDGITPVNTCQGRDIQYEPCNTKQCVDPRFETFVKGKDTVVFVH